MAAIPSDEFRLDPTRSGFMLDFDGCLSEIVDVPDQAVPVEGAVGVLRDLAPLYGTVRVVSGRRAQDVASRIWVQGIRYVGLYGAEEFDGAELVQDPGSERWRGMASRSARDAEAMISSEGLKGCVVEYKDLAVSIHYRNAESPEAESHIRTWAFATATKRGMVVVKGRKVIELRPAAMSKATVVDRLASSDLRHLFIAGDDSSDVEAMRKAGETDGLIAFRVGVGSAEEPSDLNEVSDLMVKGPAELVGLLRRFVY